MAYRNSDFERWQTMPFVVCVEIKLSNAHPMFDICDKLAGKYPKDFHWTGWHPQCICYQVRVMMSDEEYDKIEEAMLRGENLVVKSKHEIEGTLAAFNEYESTNKERIANWKSKPYWVRDNMEYFDNAGKEPVKLVSETVKGNTQPAGKNIRSQLTNIDSKIAGKVDNALIAIDSVHGDCILKDIPINMVKGKSSQAAFYSTQSGVPHSIAVSDHAIDPEVSFIHDMGH